MGKLILILWAIVAAGAEPPGPWESQSAILSADTVVCATVASHEIASEVGVSKNAQFMVNLKVNKVLKDDTGIVTEATNIFAAVEEISSNLSNLNRERFKPGAEVVAALNFVPGKKSFKPSSPWPELSLLPDNRQTRERLIAMLRTYSYGKNKALHEAELQFRVTKDNLRISVIGGEKNERKQFTFTKDSSDPRAELIWQIRSSGTREDALFFDAKTGERMEILKSAGP